MCFKGKPPTKKAKVLQKQPLMAKLAAYAQYQANQQSQVKKAGEANASKGRLITLSSNTTFTTEICALGM